jgi:quercetin dioxygenase-like cupin family protein
MAGSTSNYAVKEIETVVAGKDVQARVFTLAPGESIPWHRHSESTDHYFVLRGTLSIHTREPDVEQSLDVGSRYKITPGTLHSYRIEARRIVRFFCFRLAANTISSRAKN